MYPHVSNRLLLSVIALPLPLDPRGKGLALLPLLLLLSMAKALFSVPLLFDFSRL